MLFIQLLYDLAQIWRRVRKKEKSSFYTLPKKVVTQHERAPWTKNEIKTYRREFRQVSVEILVSENSVEILVSENICVTEYFFRVQFYILHIFGNIVETLTVYHVHIYLIFSTFIFRSSHQRCAVRKCVLRNFKKFTGKHLCQSLFFNKVAGLSPANLLKKRLWHRCFSLNFLKFLRTPFLQNTSGRLLLHFFGWLLIVKASLKVWKVFIKQYHPWDRTFYEKIHIHIQ